MNSTLPRPRGRLRLGSGSPRPVAVDVRVDVGNRLDPREIRRVDVHGVALLEDHDELDRVERIAHQRIEPRVRPDPIAANGQGAGDGVDQALTHRPTPRAARNSCARSAGRGAWRTPPPMRSGYGPCLD